jgi:hypothetical protein
MKKKKRLELENLKLENKINKIKYKKELRNDRTFKSPLTCTSRRDQQDCIWYPEYCPDCSAMNLGGRYKVMNICS